MEETGTMHLARRCLLLCEWGVPRCLHGRSAAAANTQLLDARAWDGPVRQQCLSVLVLSLDKALNHPRH